MPQQTGVLSADSNIVDRESCAKSTSKSKCCSIAVCVHRTPRAVLYIWSLDLTIRDFALSGGGRHILRVRIPTEVMGWMYTPDSEFFSGGAYTPCPP